MLKIAIVGAGGIGKFHSTVYTLLPDVKVIAVADIRAEHAAEAAKAHSALVYSSLDQMLAAEKPDIVDICTPTYLHVEMALKCMKKGINVLCEKPLALDLKSALSVANMADKKKVHFMAAQVIRFWDEYVYLRKAFQEKTYGSLKQLSFTRTGQAPLWSWENWFLDVHKSGKAPFDLHIHDADFIYFMLGKPQTVRSVWLDEPDNPKISAIRTEYDYSGTAGFPEIPVLAEGGWYPSPLPFRATFRAIFEEAILDYASDSKLMCYPSKGESHAIDLGQPIVVSSSINIDSVRPYYNEIRYFVDCVDKNTPPQVVTPQESCESLRMVLKEIQSAKTGKRVKV
jgi:predicted dehydrogenase